MSWRMVASPSAHLLLPLSLGGVHVAHSQAAHGTTSVNGVPESACVGCDPSGWLDRHIISKTFWCRPGCPGAEGCLPGAKTRPECGEAHTGAECCAGCLKMHTEEGKCDAWFLNKQGGCFFKQCTPSAWESGECHIDWEDNSQPYISGVAPRVGGSCQWGQFFLIALAVFALAYVGCGTALNVKMRGKPAGSCAAVPHYHCWRGVAALTRDGLHFTRATLLRFTGRGDNLAPAAASESRRRHEIREAIVGQNKPTEKTNRNEKKRSKKEKISNSPKNETSGKRDQERHTDPAAPPPAAAAGDEHRSGSGGGGRWVHIPG